MSEYDSYNDNNSINNPSLQSILPDVKKSLNKNNILKFEDCISNINDYNKENIQNDKLMFQTTLYDNNNISIAGYIDNVLTKDECNKLINEVDSSEELSFWSSKGRDNEEARLFRDADTIEVLSDNIATKIWNRIQNTLPISFQHVTIPDDELDENGKVIESWERELPGKWESFNLNKDLLFAKYPSKGSFSPHTDGRAIHNFNVRSFFSVIIFLNDIEDNNGGGTNFYKREALDNLIQSKDGKQWTADPIYLTCKVLPKAGRFLIFEQSLAHEGVPPNDPYCKYIIRSDIMLERNPYICNSEKDIEAYKIFKEAENLAEIGKTDESIILFRKSFKLSPELAVLMGQ